MTPNPVKKQKYTNREWFKWIAIRVIFPPILLWDLFKKNEPKTPFKQNKVIYYTKKPSYTIWEWLESIMIRIILPPILLWDTLKWIINKLIGKYIGQRILPAQHIDFSSVQIGEVSDLDTNDLTHEKYTIVTHDGAELDILEIKHSSSKNLEPKYQKYIINFVGHKMSYENIIDAMHTDAHTLNMNVVAYNYRGVSGSTGFPASHHDLVDDGKALVGYFIKKGIPPQNIILKGHFFGASIASLVALYLHQHGMRVNVYNGRAFSSITNALVGNIRVDPKANYQETFTRKILGWIAKPFIKLLLTLSMWEINADDAFKQIPKEYKDYITGIEDRVITKYGSMHNALKGERREQKAKIKSLISTTAEILKQADPITKEKLSNAYNSLLSARDMFKERKMTSLAREDGHTIHEDYLLNEKNKTGSQFFQQFARRVQVDHGINAPIKVKDDQNIRTRRYSC